MKGQIDGWIDRWIGWAEQMVETYRQIDQCFVIIIIFTHRWDLKKWVYRHEHLKNLSVQASEALGGVTINPPETNKCFELYLLSFSPLYRILFVICSILALGTHGYFYCGCILYVFLKSSVLHQVLTAVRRSG